MRFYVIFDGGQHEATFEIYVVEARNFIEAAKQVHNSPAAAPTDEPRYYVVKTEDLHLIHGTVSKEIVLRPDNNIPIQRLPKKK